MFGEYVLLAYFFIACVILALLLFCLSFFVVYQHPEKEKTSSYECGFNPFGDARNRFEVRFYLVAVLFLIFDLELSFLFPFVVNAQQINWGGICMFWFFLGILGLGFVYEWLKGALEWN